jgi:hypothetical protein
MELEHAVATESSQKKMSGTEVPLKVAVSFIPMTMGP